MLVPILLGIVAVIVLLVLVVATRPAQFRIERSITMAAPPATAFAQVNDLRAWAAWSPWEKLDPELKRTYAGAPAGAGATYAWAGNKKVGEGRMTIEESARPAKIAIKLEFIKPWTATNMTTFIFTPVAEGTRVTWSMDGHNNFTAKAASLFMNMDKLVGGDFEKGLAAMKAVAEGAAKATAAR
jgi:hypothetical protein